MKNAYGFLTLTLAVAALLLLRSGQARHSTPTLFLAGLSGIAALFVSMFAHPRITSEERKRRLLFLLDIHRPEETRQKLFEAAIWLVFIIGSPILFLRIGSMFVLFDGRLYYGLCSLVILFPLTYSIPKFKELSRFPMVINVLTRFGLCIPAVALLFCLVILLNCVPDQSVQARTVTCLQKRNPCCKNPVYYLRIQPWPENNRTVEISVPPNVYAQTLVGGNFQIMTGSGKLGLEWIRRIDAVGQQSETVVPSKIK